MSIETLDDIIEEIADKLGIYGACPQIDPNSGFQTGECKPCNCRPEFVGDLQRRIRAAGEVERRLRRSDVADKAYQHAADLCRRRVFYYGAFVNPDHEHLARKAEATLLANEIEQLKESE